LFFASKCWWNWFQDSEPYHDFLPNVSKYSNASGAPKTPIVVAPPPLLVNRQLDLNSRYGSVRSLASQVISYSWGGFNLEYSRKWGSRIPNDIASLIILHTTSARNTLHIPKTHPYHPSPPSHPTLPTTHTQQDSIEISVSNIPSYSTKCIMYWGWTMVK